MVEVLAEAACPHTDPDPEGARRPLSVGWQRRRALQLRDRTQAAIFAYETGLVRTNGA
jgi:hypothetical protein